MSNDPASLLAHRLASELTTAVPPAVTVLADMIVGDTRPLGVLFYGSVARGVDNSDREAVEQALSGVLDFYVIVERHRDWPRPALHRVANTLLPPNVEYHEKKIGGRVLRAKVAILSLAQFRHLTRKEARDISIWARFSQPVRLVWVRDTDAADNILRCVIRSVASASYWAARLGPQQGTSDIFWRALYAHTYRSELRVEAPGRERCLLVGQEERCDLMLRSAWQLAGIAGAAEGAVLQTGISARDYDLARKRWRMREKIGRPLNIVRLIKAAFTFQGGAEYLAWKIYRHSGVKVHVTPFMERHPLLSAPYVICRLIRAGVFTRCSR